ncbi:MAG: hypothetical protein ACYTF1_25160 [Planctomycetota bacterium]
MKKGLTDLAKHLWCFAVMVVGTTFVIYCFKFGIIFWPKWYNVPVEYMWTVGIICVNTFLLASIYYYGKIVQRMEIENE